MSFCPLHFHLDGYDLAVRVGLDVEGSLAASKLVENDVCVVAAPSLVERLGQPSHPSALSQFPVVGYQSAQYNINAWTYVDGEEYRTVEVHPICRVNDGNALLELVIAGLGVGYVSRFAAREAIRRGELVELFDAFAFPAFEPVFMVHASTEHIPMRLKAFKSHLRQVAQVHHQ